MPSVPVLAHLREPHALGARVRETREATRDIFGDRAVLDVLSRLDPERRALFTDEPPPAWVREADYIEYMTRLWEGPCNHDAAAFARWVDRLTDRGFGTAQRLLMSLASPWLIVRRAGALWRTEHSHGDLIVTPLGTSGGRFELRDHPFVNTALAASAIAEAFRHIVFRCRVRWATERHALSPDGALFVEIHWG